MRSCPTKVLGMSLGATLVTLACAASDSRPAVRSPSSALVAATSLGGTTSTGAGRVRIEARFRKSTSGTFAISGAIADTGSFKAARQVAGGRLQLTEVLAGRQGTIRIRASRPCAGGAGTWQALSGSGAYEELSGRGTARGGPSCARTTYPVQAVYTGTVRTSDPPSQPPPIAQPGQYGGATSDREEVLFEVAPGGRTLIGLQVRDLLARCTPPTLTFFHRISLPGPHQIAEDGSFSIQSQTATALTRVAGRFTSAVAAAGTATVSSTFTDPNTKTSYTCSASVTWTAGTPPPTATPGRYCGFTGQGSGLCLDVAADGRTITRGEIGVVVECQPESVFEITLIFTDVPIGANLGFSYTATSFEGLVSGLAFVDGWFEPTATSSGTFALQQPSFDHEGTRYRCRNARGNWDAKRQT